MSGKFWKTGLLLALISLNLQGQTYTGKISDLRTLYEDFKFGEVVAAGREFLRHSTPLLENDIKLVHEYMAIAFYTLGETDSAYHHFTILLTMDKDYPLDPIRTSPKIRDFYSEIRSEYDVLQEQKRLRFVDRYLLVEDLRPEAAWRSALIPGWGQFYKHQPARGYLLGGAFFTGLVITTGALIVEKDYREQYLSSTDPAEITDLYDRYNTWSKIRRGAMYSTIAIWLINFSDALWSDYPRISIEQPGPDALGISLSFDL